MIEIWINGMRLSQSYNWYLFVKFTLHNHET